MWNQQEELVLYLAIPPISIYLQNTIIVKQACIAYLILVGTLSSLILSVKNCGVGWFNLMDKINLKQTKLIHSTVVSRFVFSQPALEIPR